MKSDRQSLHERQPLKLMESEDLLSSVFDLHTTRGLDQQFSKWGSEDTLLLQEMFQQSCTVVLNLIKILAESVMRNTRIKDWLLHIVPVFPFKSLGVYGK